MNKKNKGFTLFELLVSISIIGILTALASVAFSGAQKKARDARRVQDIKLIQTAAEQYYSQNTYNYPGSGNYDAGDVWTPAGGTTVLESYCVCALMENTANANATSACNFSVGVKTHFCAKNQQ